MNTSGAFGDKSESPNQICSSFKEEVAFKIKCMMGLKEGTRGDEHRVLNTTDELLNSASETDDVLYVS